MNRLSRSGTEGLTRTFICNEMRFDPVAPFCVSHALSSFYTTMFLCGHYLNKGIKLVLCVYSSLRYLSHEDSGTSWFCVKATRN